MSPQGLNSSLKSLQLWLLNYLRCWLHRLMIFSRKVFWGATKPRRPPGIFTTYFDHEAPFSAISSKILLSLHFHHIVLLHILRTSSPSNGLGKWSWPETAEVCTVRTFSPSSHCTEIMCKALSFRFTENLSPCFQNKVAFHLGRTLAWKAFLIPRI